MIARKQNETLYQNNTIELSDEALDAVLGGCGNSYDGNQCQQNYGENQYNCGQGYGYDHREHNCGSLLGGVLGCLL